MYFGNYFNDNNNYLPMWDSFYTKPLGVTLTVQTKDYICQPIDTICTQKRYITFAKRGLCYGKYKGFFSTNPNKEVEIVMNNSVTSPSITYNDLYVNFPYNENDTIRPAELLIGSTYAQFPRESYNRKSWSIDTTKPYNYDSLKGILGITFEATYNVQQKVHDIHFEYLYQKSKNAPIQKIQFNGYQLLAYSKPFFF
jgi:hypothetical protein